MCSARLQRSSARVGARSDAVGAARHGASREVAGQLLRIVGAATKTVIGLVPTGNTGGSNIRPFKPVPVPPDLQKVLDEARIRPNA